MNMRLSLISIGSRSREGKMGLSDYYESARQKRITEFLRLATMVAHDEAATTLGKRFKDGIFSTLLMVVDQLKRDSIASRDTDAVDFIQEVEEKFIEIL